MKIIVHIGAGKTGTSSIQVSLRENQDILNAQGYHYMGLILEHASIKKYPWQNFPAGNFAALDNDTSYTQALDIFGTTIKEMDAKGIHTLIWSNESFLGNNDKIIPILKTLEKDHEVEIVVYLRKHEAWIKSAYIQWGIKHKTYRGKIKSFKDWFTPDKVSFYTLLEPYLESFPNKVHIKNMGAQKNLVKSFLEVCNIKDEGVEIVKSNESPSNEELLLRALFNNSFQNTMLPKHFDQHILNSIRKNKASLSKTPTEYLKLLMPTDEDIKLINETVKNDRSLINGLFESQGEESFSEDTVKQKTLKIQDDKLLMLLTQIVLNQSLEIDKLKQEVREIKVK